MNNKLFGKREPICVSHYPPPYRNPGIEEVKEAMNLGMENVRNPKNAVLYVHVPFCDVICSFCPFNKYLKEESKVRLYLDFLDKEIDMYSDKKYFKTTEFGSFALGGGTPSALSTVELCSIIYKCKGRFAFSRDMEISIEGNPSNYHGDKLKYSFQAGINRVSFGVQTFNEELNGVLELPHTTGQAVSVIEEAHELGCNNVGIDLIYNIPGQTLEMWKKDLEKAIKLGLEHITIFSQIVAPFTRLFKQLKNNELPQIGNMSEEVEMYRLAEDMLLTAGYIQYSVYDFALPNKVNLHALYYFSQQNTLLGMGPSAFGYINNFTYINYGQLNDYTNAIKNENYPVIYGEKADENEAMHGFLVKGLRLLKVSKHMFKDKFGISIEEKFPETIKLLTEEGLIEIDENELRLTKQGRIWGNNICRMFFSDTFKNAEPIQREILSKGIIKK